MSQSDSYVGSGHINRANMSEDNGQLRATFLSVQCENELERISKTKDICKYLIPGSLNYVMRFFIKIE